MEIYFQSDGLPIGKAISKPLAEIYMHWLEKKYVFGESSTFRDNIVFWKRQMDDVFFVWRGARKIICLALKWDRAQSAVYFAS